MGSLSNHKSANNIVFVNTRKARVVKILFLFILVSVFAYDLLDSKFYRDKGISGYAKTAGTVTVRGRKSYSVRQTFDYGVHSKTFSIDMIGDYSAVPSDNIVPILINPNDPDDFIIGSKSTSLPELARVYRIQDFAYVLGRSFLFWLIAWILFLVVFSIFKISYFQNANRKEINVVKWSFIGVGLLFVFIFGSMIIRLNDDSQIKSLPPSQIVNSYKLYRVSKDSVVLVYDTINAPIMLMRVDDIKIDVKIYHKPSTSYHSHDSSLYYIGMRLKDKVAVSVQATDAYQQVVQTASFCFTSDSIPVPRFNNEVQRVYFRARDTFRVFNKGQILVDTIRQFIAKQPNTFTDTLFLLDAGLEGGKVMSVFMSNNRFPRPSLRLEKSAIYDGEDIWEDTFYKSSGNYVVIYTIDKQKFSDYSYYGKIYSAFYARTTSDSIP